MDSRELKRKAVHAGMGLFALLLAWIDWRTAAILAAAALLFNLFVMPRIGRGIYRDVSKARDPGIVAYPAMVLVLILFFRHQLSAAAALWGMMAFGDPAATIVGKSVGGPKLPWNPRKTWAGLLAYALVGSAAALLLWHWVWTGSGAVITAGLIAPFLIPVVVLGAFLESIESGIDDNWIPALPCALVLAWLETTMLGQTWPTYGPWWLLVLAINCLVGAAMVALRAVTMSGAVAGALVGSVILVFGSPRHYALLWTFFALGTLATRLGYRRKQERNTAQAEGGRRGARHVLANCGVATLICVIDRTAGPRGIGLLAPSFAGAFAAALADTLGTEVGSLFGRRPVSLVERRVVPPGTPGAVSIPGIIGGILGGAAIGLVGASLHVIPWTYIPVIAAAGLLASLAESLLSDSLRRQGGRLDHEFANAFNTFVGALVPIAFLWLRNFLQS